MFRRCLQLPVSCRKAFFLVNQQVFLESCHSFVPKRGAGHSKWQNIKSVKEAADSNKSMNFQRISKQIQLAVRKGGEDPETNSKLKSLIDEAYKLNMPKSTVQKAIASAKSQQLDQPYWVVFKGPRGVALGLEVTFANKNSSFINSKIAPQTKKLNMKMEVHFHDLCSEKGVIVSKSLTDSCAEKALEDALQVGADDVFEDENKTLIFECAPERLDGICSQLSKMGYEINSATIELDFKEEVKLTDEEKKDIETIVSKLQGQYEEILRASYNSAG